jgi:YVTN family beta-propeller protein
MISLQAAGGVFVVNSVGNDISVINSSTNTVVAIPPVGINPTKIVITPDGSKAYVINLITNDVSVIDI